MDSMSKWDVTKLTIFLATLVVFGALVGMGKLAPEVLVSAVLGLLSPSMLPFGRRETPPPSPPPGTH